MFEFHDLRRNRNDLPKTDEHVLIYLSGATGYGAMYLRENNLFYLDDGGSVYDRYGIKGWISIPTLREIEGS